MRARVEAEVRYDHDSSGRVRDYGTFLDPKRSEARKPPGHWGLPSVRTTNSDLGPHKQLDCWSEAEPGTGTEVQLSVPATIANMIPHGYV